MHILVAEDDTVSRELLRRILESEQKHTLAFVGDGEEAWKALNDGAQAFEVGIFDIHMPKLDGLELLGRMRAEEKFRHTPVILCTASNDRATVQRAAGLAVSGYIVKPYTRARVVEKLQQIEAARGSHSVAAAAPENSDAVCRRLGIDAETHRTLLGAMVKDLREWMVRLRANPEAGELAKLAERADGLRGACLSLGAAGASQHLAAIKSALQTPPASGATVPLEGLEKEIALIADRLGTAAAAA